MYGDSDLGALDALQRGGESVAGFAASLAVGRS
jgi:hypothetical protein